MGLARRRRVWSTVGVVTFGLALTLWAGTWPDIYTFATDQSASLVSRLLTAPIRLADDVMITMRAGEVLRETGIPAFDHQDLPNRRRPT